MIDLTVSHPSAGAHKRFRLGFEIQTNLLASLAHDLNTPIATLLLEAQTVAIPPIDPPRQAFVRSVSEEVLALGAVIEDAFTVVSAIRDAVRGEFERCDVDDMLDASIEDCEAAATDRQITLERTARAMAPSNGPLVVSANAELLRLLFDSLLRHSLSRCPAGSNTSLRCVDRGGICEITLRDAGRAISSFPTGQVSSSLVEGAEDRTTRVRLAVCAGIAELFGGSLHAENIPAGGNEYLVALPLQGTVLAAMPHVSLQASSSVGSS